MTSFPLSGNDPALESLTDLNRIFWDQARRNAFEVFLRPRKTILNLTASSISSSTAFPQGEHLRFSFSANGRILLGLSSSRIFVLDVASDQAAVRHELKTLRRPLRATISDDGLLLVVVSSRYQANIYKLSRFEAKNVQTIVLDDAPRALSLSPTGGLVAMAYNDRIEVHALERNDTPGPRKRTVHCASVDSLHFSSDATVIWGTSADSQERNIVTITAPFYDEPETSLSPQEVQIRMWTTQVLFPSTLTGYSHACPIPTHMEGKDTWVVAYDERKKVFRTVLIGDGKAGLPYFAGPLSDYESHSPTPPSEVTIPSPDYRGGLLMFGTRYNGLWLYSMPEKPLVDQVHTGSAADEAIVRAHNFDGIPGISAVCWVRPEYSITHNDHCYHRLIAVAPDGLSPPTLGEEKMPVDSGRVLMLDFGRSTRNGEVLEVNIEFGESEPLPLKEYDPGMDAEIALERRRTLNNGGTLSRNSRQMPIRSASTLTAQPAISGFDRRYSEGLMLENTRSSFNIGSEVSTHGERRNNMQLSYYNTPRRYATTAGGRYRTPHLSMLIPQALHESDTDNNYRPHYTHVTRQRNPQLLPTRPESHLQSSSTVQSPNSVRPLSYNQTAVFPYPTIDPRTQPHQRQLLSRSQSQAAYYTLSVSSPDLLIGDSERVRQQQQNVMCTSPVARPASTDPIHAVIRQREEEWRRGIEEWNEQTIRANRKKSRTKCTVM